MKILLYHFGYRGDILVVGQNFTRELKIRFPKAVIDLMVRPRMSEAVDFMRPLGLYDRIILGEKRDFHNIKGQYELSYMIDEKVYPEGNLRTPFTKAAFPFCQHKLLLATTSEDRALAEDIAKRFVRPVIATQSDMGRKWPEDRVIQLWQRLSRLGTLVTFGPEQRFPGVDRPLSFRESAAVLAHADIFIGIDSGIAHAAALMNVQTILIPPVFPEMWISPTEYANPFIKNEAEKHISIRPPLADFCGHYFCLRKTRDGGIKRPSGDPLNVRCVWKKKWGIFKGACCFQNVSVEHFWKAVVATFEQRGLV